MKTDSVRGRGERKTRKNKRGEDEPEKKKNQPVRHTTNNGTRRSQQQSKNPHPKTTSEVISTSRSLTRTRVPVIEPAKIACIDLHYA